MSLPIIEQIIVNLTNSIAAATGLSAQRASLSDFADTPPADGLVLVILDGIATARNAVGIDSYQASITLEGYAFDVVGTAIDTRINSLASTLIKAILADITRAGKATDTRINDCEVFRTTDGFTGFSVTIEIDYRTKLGDPFTGV